MKHYFETIARFFVRPMPITDYIARCMVDALNSPHNDPESRIAGAGSIKFDLDANGCFVSTKKTFVVQDRNGIFYEITIQELDK